MTQHQLPQSGHLLAAIDLHGVSAWTFVNNALHERCSQVAVQVTCVNFLHRKRVHRCFGRRAWLAFEAELGEAHELFTKYAHEHVWRLQRRLRDGAICQSRDDFSPSFSNRNGVFELSCQSGAQLGEAVMTARCRCYSRIISRHDAPSIIPNRAIWRACAE